MSNVFSVEDARRLARRRLPRMIFDFIDCSAGNEHGSQRNNDEFDALLLQPRVLAGVQPRELRQRLLGHEWSLPFGIAPMGMCNLAWPDADRAFAEAAVRHGIPHCLSTAASTSLEAARKLAGEHAWFQLYVRGPEAPALALVQRALEAGYEHLVLTVDVPSLAPRRRELRHGFKVPFHLGPSQLLDFAIHPRWSIETLRRGVPHFANYASADTGGTFDRGGSGGAANWQFLERLREYWPHRLIVKGIMSAEDAVRVRDAGADAIYVSNHGGRQLDSAPAAICALRAVRQAVGANFPLLFDSGVRSGESIVKALALGANFVMLGRPFMFAVAAEGERGVDRMIQLLRDELGHTLAQIGRATPEDIDSGVIAQTEPASPVVVALPGGGGAERHSSAHTPVPTTRMESRHRI